MMNKTSNSSSLLLIIIFLLFQSVVSLAPAHAQGTSDISLDLVLTQQLNNAQVLSLSNLGVNRRGSGNTLFTLTLQNSSQTVQENLYLDIEVSSNNVGTIAKVYSKANTPFRLDAGERIMATNNQLQDGLPGIEEFIEFDGRITNAGTDFLNDLEGSTQLPSDIYTVTLSVYQGGNRQSGGTQVASINQEFGLNISSETSIDLYLLQPGGAIGSGASVNNQYPVFWWSGPTNMNYRLVVVRNDGAGSIEELVESSLGTEPTSSGSGRLNHEILDVEMTNTSFAMPASGVEQLADGETYYWQVFTSQQGVSSSQTTPSEIYEFTYVSPTPETGQTSTEGVSSYTQEEKELIRRSLNSILGGQQLQSLTQEGMDFNSLVIDGVTYEGKAALQKLQELRAKIQNGEITLVTN